MQAVDPERLLVSEAEARESTDYRFRWGTYIGWTILTLGFYSHYGTYRLVQRRVDHAKRRLAFSAGLWHVLAARAKDAGKEAEAQPGLDNLARVHAQLESYERQNKRNAALLVLLRVVFGGWVGPLNLFNGGSAADEGGAAVAVAVVAVVTGTVTAVIGAYINHFLNKDVRFYETWEDSMSEQAAWVLGRIGSPVEIHPRDPAIPKRDTALYVFLTIITLGLFAIWWRYAMMQDGNRHFDGDELWEYKIMRALDIQPSAAAPPLPPRF